MSKRLKASLCLLTTAAIWGISAPIVKYTLDFISPTAFLFYRFWLVSLIFLIPFLIKLKSHPQKPRQILRLFLLGLLGGPLTLLLIFEGAKRTISIDASLIVAMAPVFIVLVGAFFLKEKVTHQEMIGLTIALSGTTITIVQPLLEGNALSQKHLLGNLLVLASNFVWIAYTILSKKSSRQIPPLLITSLTFFSGLLVLTPLFFLQKNPILFSIHPKAIFGILYMSLGASVIAYTTYNLGFSLIEASEATLFTYLQPIFAAPLSFFWLKEPFTPTFIIGALLIASGVFLTETRKKIIPHS